MNSVSSFWPYPAVVVHRGGGYLAPENTLDAFVEGKRHGGTAVEFDIQTTADGRLVLSHDERLGRVIQGQGRVCEMVSDALRRLRVVNPHEPGQSAPVCFFDEAVDLCNTLGLMMNVELKPAVGCETELAQIASRAFETLDIRVPVLVSSFNAVCLERFRFLQPKQACGYLFEAVNDDWMSLARELDLQTVHPAVNLASCEMAQKAHERGLGVMVWTVDDPQEAREAIQNGADAVCTNRPETISQIF